MICFDFSTAEMIREVLVDDCDSGGVWNWGGQGELQLSVVELRVSFAWRAA